jgi:hypothetical protein
MGESDLEDAVLDRLQEFLLGEPSSNHVTWGAGGRTTARGKTTDLRLELLEYPCRFECPLNTAR